MHIQDTPVPPHPKDALLGLDLVTVRAILELNSLSCSRNQFEVAIRGWVHGGHKGVDMIRNNAQVGRGI